MSSATNIVTHARRASSSKPVVNAAKVTVRRKSKTTGRPPKITNVRSASKIPRTKSNSTFDTFY